MKNILKIVAVAAVAVAITGTVQAVPITGVIGFAGSATLDNAHANAATKVQTWGPNAIVLNDGSFASLSSAATVSFAQPWTFTSAALPAFWTITDGANTYTFNLSSSGVSSTSATSVTIALAGTVLSNIIGLDATAFTGSMTIQDPSSPQQSGFKFSESISFNPVPDGGTTVAMLGMGLTALGLIRRKLSA
jgi:hypothetical protein